MNINDELVSNAFSNQSKYFDKLDSENKLTAYLRDIYRKEIDSQIEPKSNILELNCGTGIDSVYLAAKGHCLLSTDNSSGMLDKLEKKIELLGLNKKIETQLCSFTELNRLGNRKFNYIISNFGGLNCTKDLKVVLADLKYHLFDNGKVTLVIMPKISPWEMLMAFKGKFKTAFRRFKKRTDAHIEGVHFSVYYYNPSYVIKALKKDFDIVTLKGIYFLVPPEFYQNFVERYPKVYKLLSKMESKLSSFPPFNFCCDHYLITLQLKK